MPLGKDAGIKIASNYLIFITGFCYKTLTFAARSKKRVNIIIYKQNKTGK